VTFDGTPFRLQVRVAHGVQRIRLVDGITANFPPAGARGGGTFAGFPAAARRQETSQLNFVASGGNKLA
jgi:hypothetical protein